MEACQLAHCMQTWRVLTSLRLEEVLSCLRARLICVHVYTTCILYQSILYIIHYIILRLFILYFGMLPLTVPVTVTTRIITFLVGDFYKPAVANVTRRSILNHIMLYYVFLCSVNAEGPFIVIGGNIFKTMLYDFILYHNILHGVMLHGITSIM